MLQNLHTHSTFCDGNNTPREMIEAALRLGFDSLGFSGHAPTEQNTYWETSLQKVQEYKSEVSALREEYSGKISIFLGLELDGYSAGIVDTSGLDYSIGSVHMAKRRGEWLDFDDCAEKTKRNIETLFDGEPLAFAELYYATLAELPCAIDFDIVGHFDVLTKYSEKHPDLIPTDSREYKRLALEALHTIRKKKDLFEVNTGAISRGYRTTPYPAPFLLDEMKKLDCKLVLTSDCHSAQGLDCAFEKSLEYIKAHGFDTLYYLTDAGFVGEKI